MTVPIEGPGLIPDAVYRDALVTLLWQLADDDLVLAFRDSEWLGLAPHIEEDVAFSSIGQDEMGHAAAYYGLLADLGLGTADDLAQLRPTGERRNAVLLERPNGSGTYLESPHFDWAFTVVRHYLYDVFEILRLERLAASGYRPLAEVAAKALAEKAYHLAHQELWIRRMAERRGPTRQRLAVALERAGSDGGDLPYVEPWAEMWETTGILPDSGSLPDAWRDRVSSRLEPLGLRLPAAAAGDLNGRLGRHSPDLDALLETLSAVYRLDPGAAW